MGKALSGKLSCPCDRSCFFPTKNISTLNESLTEDFVKLTMFVATGPRPEMLKF